MPRGAAKLIENRALCGNQLPVRPIRRLCTSDGIESLLQLARRGLCLAIGGEHVSIRRVADRNLLHHGKCLCVPALHTQQIGIVDAVDRIARVLLVGLAHAFRCGANFLIVHRLDGFRQFRHRTGGHPVLCRGAARKSERDQRQRHAIENAGFDKRVRQSRHRAFLKSIGA